MALIDKPTKRRFKRRFKQQQQTAVELGQQADQQIEKLLIRRFDRLVSVRRFVLLWIVLAVLLAFTSVLQLRALSPYYQQLRPAPGGIFSEGLVGIFTNANPIYATGVADTAVSRLIFSGLFKHDEQNRMVGDLARKWRLSRDHKTYVVTLRRHLTWHDGQPFTAADVVYTYRTIQKLEAQSPLRSSWEGINVSKQNDYTVVFELPSPLAAFPHSLTNGIIPAHLLRKLPPSQLRSAKFNTDPVGTGPFAWRFVEVSAPASPDRQQKIGLGAFEGYADGQPKLDGFSIMTFSDEQRLINAFNKKQINAMSGLQALPDNLVDDPDVDLKVTPSTSIVMAFYNNSVKPLDDVKVRQALTSSIQRRPLASITDYPTKLATGPLLPDQVAGSQRLQQLDYNRHRAKQLLNQSGWHSSRGKLVKDVKKMKLSLRTQDTRDYSQTARYLQKQWRDLGVNIDVHYYENSDLQSQIIANHDYDILLYGINIGPDPDVFAYWDSSQASITSQGLNLSEYKSTPASQALEAGRLRVNPKLRELKYQAFLAQWRKDAPALALYQPNFLYITRGKVYNFDRTANNASADRFYNVNNWMIRQTRQSR